MTGLVVRRPPRAAAETVDGFRGLGVATVHEAQGGTGLLSAAIRPVFAAPPVAGSALTVSVPHTCVYHQPGIELLLRVVGPASILFASELLGAVRGVDPETGHSWDDTKRYIDAAVLAPADRLTISEANVRRVYPGLDARPGAAGKQESVSA